ncbi:YdcF family protein [Oscillatoria sp. FACHB-1407]|uniref:YdcF family protein n=1 Tax=Oscillatoria sp. FACHB-1407 TaxID=2692847 RepID=UPI003F8EAA22
MSKLLPLFIYPLGLACLFLGLTLLTLWKRPHIAALSAIAALVVLLLGSNGWVAAQLVRSLEWQYVPTTLPNAEAIVVLGGGIKPQIAPRPWVDVAEAGDRVLYGAQLYQQGKAPLVVLSGGRIEWKGGGSASESEDMAKLAEVLGVPKTAIAQDPTSLNTYQNAVNVKQILQQRGINRVLLVTSAMHMPRSMGIFQKQGIEAIAAPTDFSITAQELEEYQATLQGFLLNLLPDAEKLQQTSRAMKEYVGILVYRLKGWM